MPLSDHEQRILAELEESLVRQDPEFAERVRSETVYRHAGRYCKWAAVTFVLGVVILVAFYSKSVIAGFVGVVIALQPDRNVVGQVFYASFVAASIAFVCECN